MTMARQQALTAKRPLYNMQVLLFLIITVAKVNTPALAGHSSPPATLTVYAFQSYAPPDATAVVAASPSGNLSATEFGTISAIADPVRETLAPDAPVVGVAEGPLIVEKDFSLYGIITFVLNTTSFAGSISVQGLVSPLGAGEVAIAGGTYDFRWARGYAEVSIVSQSPTLTVFKLVFHIKYD